MNAAANQRTRANAAARPDAAAAWARAAVAVLACAASVGLFFRYQIMDGFAHVFGDIIDGRIEVALLEHWYNALQGLEPWRDPIFFYPTPDVLGYNDGYFLLGVGYAAWRALGFDPFLSSELVNIALRVIGFGAFLLFAERVCRLAFGWALLGAAMFTLANGAYMQAGHAQLFTVGLAPLLGWLLWKGGEALFRHEPGRAAAWGCAAAALFDAWLLTAFYMAWFTALFALIMALAALAEGGRWDAAARRRWRVLPRWPAVAVLLVLAAGLTPFLMTYLPSLRITGAHAPAVALALAPAPIDFINTGDQNLVYGRLNGWIETHIWPTPWRSGELTVGFPLGMLGFCVCGAVLAWGRRPAPARAVWRALSAALLISAVLAVQVGGKTLWYYVYEAVPGGSAIRVISRYALFLAFPATLLATYGLARCSRRMPVALVGAFVCLLIAEQLNLLQQDRLPRASEMQFLAALPAAPPECPMFAVTTPRTVDQTDAPPDLQGFVRNVDGMLIAELLHVPTFNGHASILPVGFTLGASSEANLGYLTRNAASAYGLSDEVCGLDLETMAWVLPPLPARPLPAGRRVLFQQPDANAAAYLQRGWSTPEETGRWTDGPLAEISFGAPMLGHDLVFTLHGHPFQLGGPPSPITVFANGRLIAQWDPALPEQTLQATIPAASIARNGVLTIRLVIASPRRPSDVPPLAGTPRPTDHRQLGFWAEWFAVTESPGP